MTGENRTASPGKTSRAGIALLAVLVLGVLGLAFGADRWKQDLPVKEVHAYGMRVLSAADVVALAHIDKSQRLFSVDLDAARRRLEANPFIRSASVTRDAPGRITLTVQERVPVAVLLTDRRLYIDDSAYVLPAVKTDQLFDLPFLTGGLPAAECQPGRTVKAPAVREALALLASARAIGDDLYHEISEVHIGSDAGLLCYTAESGVPVLVGRGALPEKLAKFDGFWKDHAARQDVQSLQYVDLRFDDQVVARWNQQAEPALHERATP